MEPDTSDQNELIITLLRENQALLTQNNELLHKQETREKRRLIFKIIWYTMLLGIPLIAYYYLYSAFAGVFGGTTTTAPLINGQVPTGTIEELLKLYGVQ